MRRKAAISWLLLGMLAIPAWVGAQGGGPAGSSPGSEQSPADLLQLTLQELMNIEVVTATRTEETLAKASSSVTVITEDEIRRLGARNLADILALVPGIGITRNFVGQPEVEVRGVKTLFSEKVLVLLDGHSINSQLTNGGGFQWGYDGLSAEYIERVEVVRGPGSALYGANAFLAVVNVITRDPGEVAGVEGFAGGGSYSTVRLGGLTGETTAGGTGLLVAYRYLDTDDYSGELERDVTGASGRTLSPTTSHDVAFKLSHGGLALNGHYAQRKSGPFVGAANALNDESEQRYEDWFFEAKYGFAAGAKLKVEPKLYYDHSDWHNYWELFPEGAFGGAYPDGMILDSWATTTKLGGEVVGRCPLSAANQLVVGLSAEQQEQSNVGARQNYDPLTYAPYGGMVDVSDDPNRVWGLDKTRDLRALFAEDIWDIGDSVRVVLGARYDDYSDVGGTFNPRTSLVWAVTDSLNLRAGYGSAFRDPTFAELYNQNNPVVMGSPDLKPETVDTFEVGGSGQVLDRATVGVTLFHNQIEDLVVAGNPNINAGAATVAGVELETRYLIRAATYFGLNYTYQDAEDDPSGVRLADTPRYRGNLIFSLALPRDWNLLAHLQVKGGTTRAPGDARDDVSGYSLLNLAVNGTRVLGVEGLGVALRVSNLLDKDYVYPSPIGTTISDYPAPGRELWVNLSYRF